MVELSAAQFAAWSRAHRVTLPYPVDVSGVSTKGVAVPDAGALHTVQRVLAEPRLAVFVLRADHLHISACVLAVAAEHEAVSVAVNGDRVRVQDIATSDVICTIGAALPDLVSLPMPAVELSVDEWTRRRAKQDTAGLPAPLVAAVSGSLGNPVPIGNVAATVWRDGIPDVGPSAASWHEYREGAVATHVLIAADGATRVVIDAYRRPELVRTLGEALATALQRRVQLG